MSIEPTFGLVFGVTRMPKEGILPPVWVLYLGPVAIVADAWEKGWAGRYRGRRMGEGTPSIA
jgi:hypothetical protein